MAASIVELSIILPRDFTNTSEDSLFLDSGELLRTFGFAFMAIIGFELIEAIVGLSLILAALGTTYFLIKKINPREH
ncbi:hypothetical protein [Biformimicrobium ophioploci]|uniref:hypothetical protein n=1 Tax=Biformimicrobium ophioploci TaxID=3036711 RepID=UPI002552C5C6|nr:hypothetical protein [Microbulbifer sp. NKW57]